MIRPITVLTFLMACGSGLYLYSEKHDVQVLDRTIEKTVQQTEVLREQSRVLATEWTTLNAPERLRDYADKYLLALKAIQPTQFTSLADLDKRLPAVELPPPPPADNGQLVASTTDSDADATTPVVASTAAPDGTPLPPLPPTPSAASQQAVASAAPPTPEITHPGAAMKQEAVASAEPPRALTSAGVRPSVGTGIAAGIAPTASQPSLQAMSKNADRRAVTPAAKVADTHPAALRSAEVKPVEPRLADARPTEPTWAERQPVRPVTRAPNPPMQAAAAPRYYQPYRAPVSAQPMPVAAPYGGSLLGMARSAPPAPRPTPVAAPNWYNNAN